MYRFAIMAEAVELKNKGNEAFKNKDWPTALEFYSKAIEKNDKEPAFYTNRAQVCGIMMLILVACGLPEIRLTSNSKLMDTPSQTQQRPSNSTPIL